MAESQIILCPHCQAENRPGQTHCVRCKQNIVLNDDQPSDEQRYFITRIIKQGGQGSVFAGVDQHGKVYAIKEMRDTFTDPHERAEATRRFNTEAEILQRLTHPRIPRIYSHFTDEGRHYLTMDFVRGDDLESIIEQRGALPEIEVLDLGLQICDVLSYLHANGLIYRDVKPSNIMIDATDGKIKLVDFGIAKILNPAERGGTQIGTPGYAPPEQYQGLATPRSDIYALGATLHHLITGRDPTDEPPFSFPRARDIQPSISRRTSDALDQALKMNAQERYATMSEMRTTLLTSLNELRARQQPAPATRPTIQIQPGSAPASPPTTQTAARPANVPPTPQTQRPRPGQTAPLPQGAPPPPHPARQSSPPAPTSSSGPGWMRNAQRIIRWAFIGLVVVVLLVVVLGTALIVLVPETRSTIPGVDQVLPTAAPTAVQLGPVQNIAFEVEATVPEGADNSTIITALREAYAREIEQQHPGAQFTPTNISALGGWQQVGTENGQVRYRATMSGPVSVPE